MESKRPAEEDTDDASVKVARAGSYSDAADVTEVSTTGEEGRRASSKWDIVPEETEAGGGDAAAAVRRARRLARWGEFGRGPLNEGPWAMVGGVMMQQLLLLRCRSEV